MTATAKWDGEDAGRGRWTRSAGPDRDADPWAEAERGAASRWMWNEHPTVERLLFGDHGAVIQDQTGAITVHVPPGALAGQVRLELEPGAAAAAPADVVAQRRASVPAEPAGLVPAHGRRR